MEKSEFDRLRAGDRELWNKINNTCRRKFIAWARSRGRHLIQDAEDAFQNVVVRMFEEINNDKLTGIDGEAEQFFFSACRNQLFDILKSNKSRDARHGKAGQLSGQHGDSQLFYGDDADPQWILLLKCMGCLTCAERNLIENCLRNKFDMEKSAAAAGLKNADVASQRKYIILQKLKSIAKNHPMTKFG